MLYLLTRGNTQETKVQTQDESSPVTSYLDEADALFTRNSRVA